MGEGGKGEVGEGKVIDLSQDYVQCWNNTESTGCVMLPGTTAYYSVSVFRYGTYGSDTSP